MIGHVLSLVLMTMAGPAYFMQSFSPDFDLSDMTAAANCGNYASIKDPELESHSRDSTSSELGCLLFK